MSCYSDVIMNMEPQFAGIQVPKEERLGAPWVASFDKLRPQVRSDHKSGKLFSSFSVRFEVYDTM